MRISVEFDDDVTRHEVQQRAFELVALWRKPVTIHLGSGGTLSFDENGGSVASEAGSWGRPPVPRRHAKGGHDHESP